MRIIFYAGKGGVGKTTVSAATGLRCAELGHKTLIMSLDVAHSLADVFDLGSGLMDQGGGRPVEVAPRLWIQEIDLQKEIEANWGDIHTYITTILNTSGLDEVLAEELAILPGMEEISLLLHINHYRRSKRYDVILLDCAPTGEALRFISMPTSLEWYMKKVFKLERSLFKVSRPLLKSVSPVPLPDDTYFQNLERLYSRLEGVDALLHDPQVTTVRLVTNPEKIVIRETQRAFMYFCLYGLCIDGVVVNRVLPPSAGDDFFRDWRELQARYLAEIGEFFAPVPVRTLSLCRGEVLGVKGLEKLGRLLFEEEDPSRIFFQDNPYRFVKKDGKLHLSMKLPFVMKGEVELHKADDELIVRVGSFKKHVSLPRSFIRSQPVGARIEGDRLVVHFEGEAQAGERRPGKRR